MMRHDPKNQMEGSATGSREAWNALCFWAEQQRTSWPVSTPEANKPNKEVSSMHPTRWRAGCPTTVRVMRGELRYSFAVDGSKEILPRAPMCYYSTICFPWTTTYLRKPDSLTLTSQRSEWQDRTGSYLLCGTGQHRKNTDADRAHCHCRWPGVVQNVCKRKYGLSLYPSCSDLSPIDLQPSTVNTDSRKVIVTFYIFTCISLRHNNINHLLSEFPLSHQFVMEGLKIRWIACKWGEWCTKTYVTVAVDVRMQRRRLDKDDLRIRKSSPLGTMHINSSELVLWNF